MAPPTNPDNLSLIPGTQERADS
ncbi:rCG58538 [Rattus norvegicus]|uniref:RCG58538 n=1 Tax=Rattus norvegicus TaxID=10116 RepID=A6K6Z6_RAT|nr:rCG58538 [Rattus norvegicus]